MKEFGPPSDEPREDDPLFLEAIKRAQEITKEKGLLIGQSVSHPSCGPIVYVLKEIDDNKSEIWIPGQEDSIKTVTTDELYRTDIAMNQVAIGLMARNNNDIARNN